MFKDFDITPFKKMKPPVDSGYTTRTEINELKKIPLKKDFVKKFDDIETAFAKTAKDNNVEDYDKSIAAKLIKDSAPVILELKKFHNRPRPKDLDKKLPNYEMASMKTKSYPSGHSVQGILIAKVLGDKYPKEMDAFIKRFKQNDKSVAYELYQWAEKVKVVDEANEMLMKYTTPITTKVR